MRAPVLLRAYRGLMRLLAGPLLLWLWWRGRREPGYRQRLWERLGLIEAVPQSMGCLWLHAASVGEVQAAAPLLEHLLREWPEHAVVVTTQTPTGAAALQQRWGQRLRHLYTPLDTPGSVRRFVERLQPQLLVLMERELWPELLWQCQQHQIKTALVNARLKPSAARLYARWPRLFQHVWQHLAWVGCVDAPSRERFQALGVKPEVLHGTGNLKFDAPAVAPGPAAPLPDGLNGRRLLVAGSTHEIDEEALLTGWSTFAPKHPNALLVLAPRHPQRFDSVADRLQALGLPHARRSRVSNVPPDTQVLLLDTMGELPRWYAKAQGCFIGGTLAPVGGHNALEALANSQPVLFGPHTEHFGPLYEAIEAAGVGVRIDSGPALYDQLTQWWNTPSTWAQRCHAAQQFVTLHRGASHHTLQGLRSIWAPAHPARLGPVQTLQQGKHTFWFDPTFRNNIQASDWHPSSTNATALATGSGRGQAHKLNWGNQAVVLRHYRRGGLMARLSRDRYWNTTVFNSRAMREFALLRLMHSWDLPTPQPVAAHFDRKGLAYTADIAVAWIAHSRNTVQYLMEAPLPSTAWEAIGHAIAQLHNAQVDHTDLNSHNVLLDAEGRAWIVDFDKCAIRPGDDWKHDNLIRLLRSLRKEAQRCHPFHWRESDWQHLLQAYQRSHKT